MSKVTIPQMVKMLHTITQDNIYKTTKFEYWSDVLEILVANTEHYNAPFELHEVDVIPTRYPILSQARNPKSMLVNELMDRVGLACLVSDDIIKGRDGLYFVALLDDWRESEKWLRNMKNKELLIHELDGEYVFASPLRCFIH